MSFMFNPSSYDEWSAMNKPVIAKEKVFSLKKGVVSIANEFLRSIQEEKSSVFAFEGYATADFFPLVNYFCSLLKANNCDYEIINVADYYRGEKELETQFKDLLPFDKEKDPVLLFGKRVEGGYEVIYDQEKYQEMVLNIQKAKNNGKKVVIYGFGSAYSEELRTLEDKIIYLDLIPKEAVLRAKSGRSKNLGDKSARPFKEMMRRNYYVDFELALNLRTYLLRNHFIDYYIDSTNELKMLTGEQLFEITKGLAKMPFRCKPVYIEGVWGGQYVKKQRNVPDTLKNIAWVFDFIPMEVSVAIDLGKDVIDIPFYTFLQCEATNIMGAVCDQKFNGYFPIRFNYDDTYHSSGNMSIQVHSGAEYNIENYNEFGRQDESYYVVLAGHGAKTYLGFNNGIDPEEFIEEAKKSEKEHCLIDYQKYINAVESKPGVQVMIPAGTIHASGRNQLILEIGSLTIGSYTYKMYDYLRLDLDGVPRPIHTYHGNNVLCRERNTDWVNKNIVQAPRVIRAGENWCEKILGEHDLLYFSLRHLEFEKEIQDDTNGKFHVLSLVDGQSVIIESIDNPEYCFKQNFLDIVVVPANIGRYRIRNLGNCPVIVHKTVLKDNFENE